MKYSMTSAQRYNSRKDKIFETYYKQQKEKQIISQEIYGTDFEKLSEEKKRNVDHIWGDRRGIK